MEAIDRIIILMEGEKLDQKDFCKKIGENPATFSSQKNRKSSVKDATLFRIKKAYPDVSLDWLIMGEGSMWTNEVKPAAQTAINVGHENTIIQNHQIPNAPTAAYSSECLKLLEEKQTKIDQLSGQVQILKELLANR